MAKPEHPDHQQLEEWHKDPSNWKLGLFYYNKKDKRIMIAKRISALGWTFNFASPYAIPLMILIFSICGLLIKFS